MSAPTLKPVKPRNRLQTLATVLTWVLWLAVAVTALQLIPAVTRSGALFISAPNSQPNALVCLNAAQQLLQHAGIGLSHPGLSAAFAPPGTPRACAPPIPPAGSPWPSRSPCCPLACCAWARSTW